MAFVFDIHCRGYPRRQENGRPLQFEDFNTAFYGHLPDGSPAFGDNRADPPEDPLSPNTRTVPNSPVGDQLSALHDGAVGGPCQTSADGGKPGVQGGQPTQLGGLKRLWSPEDVPCAGVKRRRSSKPENPARKAGSRDEGDRSSRDRRSGRGRRGRLLRPLAEASERVEISVEQMLDTEPAGEL